MLGGEGFEKLGKGRANSAIAADIGVPEAEVAYQPERGKEVCYHAKSRKKIVNRDSGSEQGCRMQKKEP